MNDSKAMQPAPQPTVLECLCKDRCLHAGMYQCRGLPSPLAAPLPEQEPVALPCCGYADASAIKWNPYNQVVQCHNCGQTYTAPPQRKPLTDVELADLWYKQSTDWMEFARAIEAAHGIKEEA